MVRVGQDGPTLVLSGVPIGGGGGGAVAESGLNGPDGPVPSRAQIDGRGGAGGTGEEGELEYGMPPLTDQLFDFHRAAKSRFPHL